MSDSKWESVCWQNDRDRRDEPASQTHRLRVPGGWLYRCMVRSKAWVVGGHTAVVKVTGYAGGIALSHVESDWADR